jgi:hypothetical protein
LTSAGDACFGSRCIEIDRAWLPEGASVTAVRGTSGPRDGVSMISWRNLVEVASCRCVDGSPVNKHAGRVVRVVVQALVKRRLQRMRLLGADIVFELNQIKLKSLMEMF